eukprot:6501697-Lingulodinium_polyedra.AAC.1
MAPYRSRGQRSWTVCTSCYTDAASASWVFLDRIGRSGWTHCRCGASWVLPADSRPKGGQKPANGSGN